MALIVKIVHLPVDYSPYTSMGKLYLIFHFQFSNYETVAEGYGGKGLRLDRTNEDIIPEILQDAIKLSREGHSVLVNALIGKTNFREGSISV